MCIDSTLESSSQTVQYVNGQWYEELGKYVSNGRDSLDRAAPQTRRDVHRLFHCCMWAFEPLQYP